jgi:hypothetical protein
MSTTPVELIQAPMTTNYIFQTFTTSVIMDRKLIQNGLHPNMPLVVSCRNTDYNDFQANGFKYIFIFETPLADFLDNSDESIKRSKIINYEQVSLNYYTPLVNQNRSIMTLGQILSDPLLYSKKPLQNYLHGPNFGTYCNSVVIAYRTIVASCPYDMTDVDYYQPRYYLAKYPILGIASNVETLKESIIMVMKYKNTTTGQDCVLLCGGGLMQIVVDAHT